jgi:hypothetical protein
LFAINYEVVASYINNVVVSISQKNTFIISYDILLGALARYPSNAARKEGTEDAEELYIPEMTKSLCYKAMQRIVHKSTINW